MTRKDYKLVARALIAARRAQPYTPAAVLDAFCTTLAADNAAFSPARLARAVYAEEPTNAAQ